MNIRVFRTVIIIFFVLVLIVFGIYRVRMMMLEDSAAPEISSETDSLQASVAVTDEELLAGMSAMDDKDGDVTESLVVASKSKFIKKGTLRVNYAAFDSSNNVGTYTRELTYTDYQSPRFSISQPLRYLSGVTNVNYLSNVRATDCIDNNISSQIMYTLGEKQMTSDVASVQPLNLQVTNSAGDTAVIEMEIRYDDYVTYYTQSPHLSNYVMYLKVGDTPDYRSLLDGVWAGNVTRPFADTNFDPLSDVEIDDSGADLGTPGAYTVVFRLSRLDRDNNREALGTAELLVIVEG